MEKLIEDDSSRPPPRHSLPSIQEALVSSDQPRVYSPAGPALPAAPTSAHLSYFPPSSTSPTHHRPRTFSTDRHGPPPPHNPFARARSPFLPAVSAAPPPPPALDPLPRPPLSDPRPPFSDSRPPFSAPGQNNKLPTLHPLRTNPSPPPALARPSHPYNNYSPPTPTTYDAAASHATAPVNPKYAYPPSYAPGSAPTLPNHYHQATTSYSAPPRPYNRQWDSRPEEHKLDRASFAPYGESVKRHLESFDLEASLNEMAEGAGRITDFSRIYRQRAHETQRIGMTPQSMPRIEEVDEMMKQSEKMHISLQRMRDIVLNHQASLVETPQDLRYARMNGYDHDVQSNHGDAATGAGGFAGSDPKKRRGRAAPPGRCHSCNRAETPEWRRGPDGARTLCNACGLHYAKLTRKMGSKSMAGSNLRSKSIDQGSPTG